MKKTVINLSLLFLVFFAQSLHAIVVQAQSQKYVKSGDSKLKKKNFKRTFTDGNFKDGNFKKVTTFTKKNTLNKNVQKKTENIQVSLADFAEHLAPGKNRVVAAFEEPHTMDIGTLYADQKETWTLVKPEDSSIKTIVLSQMEASGSALERAFGEGTHVVYSEENNVYELYDLNEEELFFIGYTEEENGVVEEYFYDQAKSPVPLVYGDEHISVVNFMDEENPGTFVIYTDIYNVVGEGTLQTYDGGEADALKMIYTEEERIYIDYELVNYEVRYEMVFYSKKGHYITADIADPSQEGEVILENLIYQKLQEKTASVNDANKNATQMFPNPVNAGQILQFQSLVSLENTAITLFNVTGKKLAIVPLSASNNNQYEISVPENLSSGLYFYNVQKNDGSKLTSGKIQIK